MHRFRRPNAATIVVAQLAAFALVTGSATAARLITGKQVKNNSITGKDIKNRSIKFKDIGFYNGDGTGETFTVESREVTLQPGQTSYDALGGGSFKAQCPRDTTVVGTGFNGPVLGDVGFVQKYGNFVGAFMVNSGSLATEVTVQAICAYGWDNDSGLALVSSLHGNPQAAF